jgi:hypothetical protein
MRYGWIRGARVKLREPTDGALPPRGAWEF